jgi:hypothetical protein
MATYGFQVYLAWNGDEARGREMERNVNAAFYYDADDPESFDEDDPVFKGTELGKVKSLQRDISAKLYKKPCLYDEFDEVSLFNAYEYGDTPPRTLYVRWEENQNTPYECFAPIFKVFPDLEFFLQCKMDYVSSDDSYRYQVFTYHKGRETTLSNEEFDNFDAYDARCRKGKLELRKWLGLGEEQFKTPEQCLALVQRDGMLLRYARGDNWRLDIQLAALKQNGLALRCINFDLNDADDPDTANAAELCLAAVKQNSESLRYAPPELRTMELCLAAVKQNGESLLYVPKELQTMELCLAAVEQNEAAWGYVQEELRDEVAKAAGLELEKLELQRLKRWLDFVRKNPSDFPRIPEKYRTREICLIAVESRGGVCAHIPTALQSEEFFIEAVNVNTNGKALKYVPDEFRTLNVCLASVKKFPETIEYVPAELREQVKKTAEAV